MARTARRKRVRLSSRGQRRTSSSIISFALAGDGDDDLAAVRRRPAARPSPRRRGRRSRRAGRGSGRRAPARPSAWARRSRSARSVADGTVRRLDARRGAWRRRRARDAAGQEDHRQADEQPARDLLMPRPRRARGGGCGWRSAAACDRLSSAELGEDARDVVADRLLGQAHAVGDLRGSRPRRRCAPARVAPAR